ncbi:14153_t:CDS:2 [Dentiscutata erythropus]|uniref:14153_t:CDS:1 n=1 Tax=Dentiscutata erythropus TaxID=1348616 RepID=A0A9N9API3_9GLOM|nr:14153_t:CDS:2 [Dentiscutata erythropus]
MIQNLPNELHIEILNYFVIETKTVCKKWNTLVPLVLHEAVTSRLNSGLKLEFTYGDDAEWTKKLSPTYDDFTKTFTFQFYSPDDGISRSLKYYNGIRFTAFLVKNNPSLTKLGAELGHLAFPEIVNTDICKYEFDYRSNICFKRVTNEDKSNDCVKLYSFTIEAWKLCYILDCLKFDTYVIYA